VEVGGSLAKTKKSPGPFDGEADQEVDKE